MPIIIEPVPPSHRNRNTPHWANENTAMYPDERFIAVEYEATTVE